MAASLCSLNLCRVAQSKGHVDFTCNAFNLQSNLGLQNYKTESAEGKLSVTCDVPIADEALPSLMLIAALGC